MSKKLKKQSVYSVADLESLKGFTVDEVKLDSRGLNVTMKLVKQITTKRIQFSDLCVAFWKLNKTTKGGGLLPYLNIREELLWREKTLRVETSV